MLPYTVPRYFDKIISGLYPNGVDLPELGGVKGINHRGFYSYRRNDVFCLPALMCTKDCRYSYLIPTSRWQCIIY
ncbi:MAG: hypothetical protein U0Z17_02390 [Bacteroidales bacterium]